MKRDVLSLAIVWVDVFWAGVQFTLMIQKNSWVHALLGCFLLFVAFLISMSLLGRDER